MSTNQTGQVDLVRLFGAVTNVLKDNQQTLNTKDEYNHNHGDNMVDNFQVITKAMRAKKRSAPSEQLSYASEVLNQRAQSGSGKLYAQGLAQAADRLQGKPMINQEDAMLLVQSLLGGQTAAPNQQSSGMDLLGSLLGGQTNPSQGQTSGGDLLGGLFGALMGGSPDNQSSMPQTTAGQNAQGIDLNMLMNAGMTFFQARQQGMEPAAALVQAVMAGSQMQSTAHRAQSGELVAQTLLTTLGSMLSRKR